MPTRLSMLYEKQKVLYYFICHIMYKKHVLRKPLLSVVKYLQLLQDNYFVKWQLD